jgi:hypothetical protein
VRREQLLRFVDGGENWFDGHGISHAWVFARIIFSTNRVRWSRICCKENCSKRPTFSMSPTHFAIDTIPAAVVNEAFSRQYFPNEDPTTLPLSWLLRDFELAG